MIINKYKSSNIFVKYIEERAREVGGDNKNFYLNFYFIIIRLMKLRQFLTIKILTKKVLNNFYSRKNIPLFTSIEIETINMCNGVCAFCPVNRNVNSRKFKLMDIRIFKSIIKQLKKLDYNGRLSLHSNNEPFMDNRIVKFAEYARKNLPKAYIYLYTNGSLLTLEKFTSIIPYLNKIIINNYNDNLKLHDNLKKIDAFCKKNKLLNSKVEIRLRKEV